MNSHYCFVNVHWSDVLCRCCRYMWSSNESFAAELQARQSLIAYSRQLHHHESGCGCHSGVARGWPRWTSTRQNIVCNMNVRIINAFIVNHYDFIYQWPPANYNPGYATGRTVAEYAAARWARIQRRQVERFQD